MNTLALLSAVIGFLIVAIPLVLYFRTIPRGTVPKKMGGFLGILIAGVTLNVFAVFLGITGTGTAGPLVYIPAALGILLAAPIFFLFLQPKAPLGDIKVAVGDKVLPFSAKTWQGADFNSAEIGGKRVLLKFYRGGWCPYCSAELMAFDEMSADLEKFGVNIFALSKDTPEEASLHKSRDSLSFPLLSDPDTAVIRAYGVEHHKALGITKNPTTKIGGIPLGLGSVNYQTMAIPTTLLIDETGTIRWIDQSEDYRIRSSTQRVIEAVKAAFG